MKKTYIFVAVMVVFILALSMCGQAKAAVVDIDGPVSINIRCPTVSAPSSQSEATIPTPGPALDPEQEYQRWLRNNFPNLAGSPTGLRPTPWTQEMVRAGYGSCNCQPDAWAKAAAIGEFELQWTKEKGMASRQTSMLIPTLFTASVIMKIKAHPRARAGYLYSFIYRPDEFVEKVAGN